MDELIEDKKKTEAKLLDIKSLTEKLNNVLKVNSPVTKEVVWVDANRAGAQTIIFKALK